MIDAKYFWIGFEAAFTKIPRNLILCFVTLAICCVLGMGIALIRTYHVPFFGHFFDLLIPLGKAFPANLIMLICIMVYTYKFNDVKEFFHLNITIRDVNLVYIAIFALVIVSLPGISELFRSGLKAVSKDQFEAGYAVGMSFMQTFRDIVFPQMIRVVIPNLTNTTLSLMKTTALVNVMGVSDILKEAQDTASIAYCYLEAYLAATVIFWGLGIIIEQTGKILEKYFSKSVKLIA